MNDGNNGSHHKQHYKLIHAVHGKGNHIAGDHLPALGAVQDLADHHAQCHRNGDGNDGGQDHAGDAPNLPVSGEDQADLTGHGAQRHAEVQAHTGHNGDQQAQDQECVTAQTGHDLIQEVGPGKARLRNTVRADQDEHNGDGVVADELQKLLPEALAAGYIRLFHAHFPPSVLRVRA